MSGMYDEKAITRKDLIRGLIGDHVNLWHNNAWFHAAVTSLADMLPLMVNGFAAEAEKQNVDHEALLAKIMRGEV